MKLREILRDLDYERSSIFPRGLDIDIKGVSSDSKTAGKDYLFIAVQGTKFDGHQFAGEAAKNGAAAVVLEKEMTLPGDVARIFVRDSRTAVSKIACNFFGRPVEKLRCIGITGTNGKTTISYLMEAIVSAAGRRAGVIGTISHRIGNRVIPAANTTPGPIELYNFMSEMVVNSSDYLVMEVSSHALDQKRTGGIDFAAAIFTNLTGDHLDYHKTFDGYFKAKAGLFENLSDRACAVINIDDEWGGKLLRLSKGKIVTYGTKLAADYLASDIKLSLEGTGFIINFAGGELAVDSRLIGLHNVYNMTAAAACAINLGFSAGEVKRGLENLKTVPGRLEPVDCGQPFKIFVDYAHTDDALFNVLSALRPLIEKKVIVVFGCGGDRDRTKRPRMGKVVCDMADIVIVTSDNPRGEEPRAITEQVIAGTSKKNYKVILDRSRAIEEALSLAKDGDCVLIAGKGHEAYQVLKNTTVAFDDREAARKICLTQKIS